MTFPELQQSLNQLKRQREIHYEFIQPAFCVEVPDDLSEVFIEEEDEETYFRDLQQRIMDKVKVLEKARIEKVDQVGKGFSGNFCSHLERPKLTAMRSLCSGRI